MSDILMPGQGGKRSKRKKTTNEIHNEIIELQQNMGSFARAVGNDLQQMHVILMTTLKHLGLTKEYACKKCNADAIVVPDLPELMLEPACPVCGEVLGLDEEE